MAVEVRDVDAVDVGVDVCVGKSLPCTVYWVILRGVPSFSTMIKLPSSILFTIAR